jgi:polar amino acid transport system ATP-binding protein
MEPMVQAINVRKSFGDTEVLKGIDLTVGTGEVVSLLGPSGSGKSTFLRCINHLERVDAGRLLVAGALVGYTEHGGRLREMTTRQITGQRRMIGMVFQQFNLFPHMTALDNITLAPRNTLGTARGAAEQEARELLAQVGLAD